MKKLLAIICAAAMLMGMMGTVAMAADTTIKTYNNTTSITFTGSWNDGSNNAGKYADVTDMNTYFVVTPANAGLTKGVYELIHTPRSQGGSCMPEIKYDFSGKATTASDTAEVLDTVVAGSSLYLQSGNASNFVGIYSFNGTEEETIKVGAPCVPEKDSVDDQLKLVNIIFHPITEKTVTKRYKVTRGQSLTMPIMPELLGETKDIEWTSDCAGTVGSVQTGNGNFTYSSEDVNAEHTSFVLTGILGSSTITVKVEIDIVDDNAIYFDDAEGTATGTVDTIYNSGFGGSRKALGDSDSFKWNITGIDAGVYDAYFHKTGEDGFDDVQNITVNYNGKSADTSVSFLADGKEGWVKIGTFDFAGNGSEYIETTRKNTSEYYYATADAVKLVPVEKETTRTINLFAGKTYKENALLTFADSDSEYLPEITRGDATAVGNTVIYTAGNEDDTFEVSCGDYTINYTVNVSEAPEIIYANVSDVTPTGTWTDSTLVKGYDGETFSITTKELGANVKWTIPSSIAAGYYKLQVWKHNMGASSNAGAIAASKKVTDVAQLDIEYNGEKESFLQRNLSFKGQKVTVNSKWLDIGTYFFSGSGNETVTMTDIDSVSSKGELYFGGFRLVPVTAATASVGTYKEDYAPAISALEAGVNLTSKFVVSNDSQGKNANVIKAIYNNGALESVEFLEEVYIEPYSSEEIHHVFTAPAENDGDDKKVVIYLWDRENGLVPVANNVALD